MGTDSLGSGGGESTPGPAANPGEWLTVSAWVCDSGSMRVDSVRSVRVWQRQCACGQRQCACVTASVGVKPETGRAAVSGPAWGWGGGEPGALSLRAGDAGRPSTRRGKEIHPLHPFFGFTPRGMGWSRPHCEGGPFPQLISSESP